MDANDNVLTFTNRHRVFLSFKQSEGRQQQVHEILEIRPPTVSSKHNNIKILKKCIYISC